MKVLITIVNLGLGGTQQAMVYLLPELRRRGIFCEVASMLPPHQVGDDLEAAGIPVHRFHLKHRWSVAEAALQLSRLHKKNRYDVIHGKQYFGSIYAAAMRPLAPGTCIVASFHNHEYDYPAARPWWLDVRRRIQAWKLSSWVDAYGALSTETVRHYQRHLGLEPITVLPNAVPVELIKRDPSLDRDQILAPYGLAPGEPCIAVPNRLTHEKGHLHFVRALKLLRDRGLTPRALLLGKGPLHQTIAAEVKNLRLESQVYLPGVEVPNHEFRRVMMAADVVAVPSVFEAFGLVPAEAMALGAAVVASNTGGLKDLIVDGTSGLLVPPRDEPALADALERLLRDPGLRAELGRGARKRIEDEFSTSVVAGKFEAFYEAALARRRTGVKHKTSVGVGV